MSVWFITGAARGFGREVTAAALSAGDQVVATAREPERVLEAFPDAGDALAAFPLDVMVEEQARDAVQQAVARFGRIDVLFNNAGYGLFGSVEETSDASVRTLFDTNVFGLLNVTRAVLPTLRSQRSGHILLMSSSAGFAAGAGRGLYGASKFAVEAIGEALHGEISPLGVHVTIVEPGSFRTGFLTTDSRRQSDVEIDDYRETVGQLQTSIAASDGRQPGDPVEFARALRNVVALEEPPLRIQLGSDSVRLVEGKLASVRSELDRWRELSISTDFPTD